ncbi:unnamed protein product [Paramecium sonneborni]|uniref:Uncharacterized protein n=1 Tax=Paramecium sonneborni TaxID=65129 RepID=A0A8S1NNN0_9CILI|nr:unnamed protein product [Paramecium sonneborni]
MYNCTFPYQPLFCYYPMQTFTPYIMYPQQIVVQTQIQLSEQQVVQNDNYLNNLTKQHYEETKPHGSQDNVDLDLDVEYQDEKVEQDEDYRATCLKENQEKSYAVNQLIGSTNLQKNYAKAVILYIKQQNVAVVAELGDKKAVKFYRLIRKLQNNIKNITHITKYTRDEDFIRVFRILCNKFLRKDYVSYIYNSKIQQKTSHLKGKHIIRQKLFKI